MLKNTTSSIALITLVIPVTSVFGQAQPVEEVKVWGTQVNSSSVYLGEDQIALKQADHLSDLLRDIPGVDIGGSHSVNQRINIRGLDDTDLNVSIDGAKQSNYMYHHMGNLLVNTDILKAVDVQVGANSVISGGIGGAVKFETKNAVDLLEADQQIGGRIQTSYQSNALSSFALTGYGQLTDKLNVLAYGSNINRENFKDGEGIEVFGSDGTLKNIMVKFGYDFSDTIDGNISYDQYSDDGRYAERPDMGVRLNQQLSGSALFPTQYDRETLTANVNWDVSQATNLKFTVYNNEMDLQRLNETSNDLTNGISSNGGFNLLGQTIFDESNIQHTLTYGTEYIEQETDYTLTYGDGTAPRFDHQQADDLAFYLEDKIDFNDSFSLTPGIRVDDYEINTASNNNAYREWTYGLAGELMLNDSITLLASQTEIFKGPELSEIFTGTGIGNQPNPNLKPENGTNSEIGLRFLTTDLESIDLLSANLTFFKTDLDNKIEEVDYPLDTCLGRGCPGWYDNTGKVEIDGFEASLNLRIANLSTSLSYAKSDSEVITSGTPLEREVGDSIGFNVSYLIPNQNISLNWTSQIILDENSSATNKEGYDIHNISALWQPTFFNGLDVTFGIDNVFDALYVSHASRVGSFNHPVFGTVILDDYEPGRNIKATFNYRL